MRHLEDLSEVEQRLFYTRVLCTNFNFLYQHLNTPAILEQLEERGLIDHYDMEVTSKYSETCAQNTLAVHRMQLITAPPNCLEKLCEILGQNHIATRLSYGKNTMFTKQAERDRGNEKELTSVWDRTQDLCLEYQYTDH